MAVGNADVAVGLIGDLEFSGGMEVVMGFVGGATACRMVTGGAIPPPPPPHIRGGAPPICGGGSGGAEKTGIALRMVTGGAIPQWARKWLTGIYGGAPIAGNLGRRWSGGGGCFCGVLLSFLRGWAILGHIKGRILEVVEGGDCVESDFGFGGGNRIGKGILVILAFNLNFCKARATITCSCSSVFPFCNEKFSDCCVKSFRDDQADMAAFFSACFLFFAGSPVNIQPANSTVQVKTGKCPSPDLNVVYVGKDAPTLCETSCKRFLYTPVSSSILAAKELEGPRHASSLRATSAAECSACLNVVQ